MRSYPNLKLRGRVWHYEFERDGERYRGSTNTHIVREAMAIVRQKIDDAEAGKAVLTERGRDVRVFDMTELATWDRDRSRLAATCAKKDRTIASLWSRISTFFEAATDVNDDSLRAYANKMLAEGYSSSTIKRDLWALRRAYAWVAPQLALPALGPMPTIADSQRGKARGRVLEHDELAAFLTQLKGHALAHAILAVSTGIRRTELERVERSWLKMDIPRLELPDWATKGRRDRWHPLTADAFLLAKRYLPLSHDPTKPWETAAKKAGVQTIAMRDLRHTFASRMSRIDPDAVRIICGWKSGDKNASMFYQHLDDFRAERIVKAVPTVFPYLHDHAKRALA